MIVRMKLRAEEGVEDNPRADLFSPIRLAWDTIAYDRYEAGSDAERGAGVSLNFYSMDRDGGSTIKLSDPLQVKVIDALTEAVGIPHEKGQTEFEIPEQLRGQNYPEWCFSSEYKARV